MSSVPLNYFDYSFDSDMHSSAVHHTDGVQFFWEQLIFLLGIWVQCIHCGYCLVCTTHDNVAVCVCYLLFTKL